MNDLPILYSTGCPKCNVLKKKLQEKNIEYIECKDVDVMQGLGIEAVPVLKVGDELLDFMSAVNWTNTH